jgi:hypothetical protein
MSKLNTDDRLKLMYGRLVALMGSTLFIITIYNYYYSHYAPAVVSGLFFAVLAGIGWRPIIKNLFPTFKQKK